MARVRYVTVQHWTLYSLSEVAPLLCNKGSSTLLTGFNALTLNDIEAKVKLSNIDPHYQKNGRRWMDADIRHVHGSV